MNERPRRPAPRTLSATPAPSSRVPQSTAYQTRFPSLVAVIAGGALVPACADVECGSTRADELQAHGTESLREARGGRASNALHELGVALGLVKHTSTSRISAPGEAPVVTTTPQPVIQPPGAAPVVDPTPPPIAPSGGPMQVQPEPPQPPPRPPPHQRTTPRPPQPPERMPVPGGLAATQTQPPQPPAAPADPRLAIEGGVRAVEHAPAERR